MGAGGDEKDRLANCLSDALLFFVPFLWLSLGERQKRNLVPYEKQRRYQ